MSQKITENLLFRVRNFFKRVFSPRLELYEVSCFVNFIFLKLMDFPVIYNLVNHIIQYGSSHTFCHVKNALKFLIPEDFLTFYKVFLFKLSGI